MYQLGVDIGGTFTDFRLIDERTGAWMGGKAPTTPQAPEDGVVEGLTRLLATHGIRFDEIRSFSHGTTLPINTIVSRTGAKLALLTTAGFRDVLEMRRMRLERPINLYPTRAEVLIPRARVAEIDERVLVDGTVERVPSREQVVATVRRLVDEHAVEGVVVAFIGSYAWPAHEELVRDIIQEEFPGLPVTCSGSVLPQVREYERTVAAVITAYVTPSVHRYVARLRARLSALGFTGEMFLTRSNGGKGFAEGFEKAILGSLLSGPASGVTGAAEAARAAGVEQALTLDLGGTTADLGVLRGQPAQSRESRVGDFPITVPAVEITAIGAGGGSLAEVDRHGVLRVGPRSAGSFPGPACYGRGGTQATLTDALVVLGHLYPSPSGGTTVDERAARTAVEAVGERLGMPAEDAAEAIVQIAMASMNRGITDALARHGLDPRDTSLLLYGGAGPLVASRTLEDTEFRHVVIPPGPGTLCALGAALAPVRTDVMVPVHAPAAEGGEAALAGAVRLLRRRVAADSARERTGAAATVRYAAAMRYEGQAWELDVPLPEESLDAPGLAGRLVELFAAEHRRLYGHADSAATPLVIELHATENIPSGLSPRQAHPGAGHPAPTPVPVRLGGRWEKVPAYDRLLLRPGDVVEGPAMIHAPDSSTVVFPGLGARVDQAANIILERNDRG
ncbi:hydantoinase/oxoprolinase family protein [Streptosporangium sp. NPDC051022]|uniref:hydantoinase/oxoprolinase family protein n=1 Tax=Streptosporangium sp. NPDC051022 TaxID=3155752 RepID=UPI0034460252